MIITNDVQEANKFLPGVPAYNFDLAKDYSILKNARYLLLANSSFSYFPAFTSDTVQYILAPKYWVQDAEILPAVLFTVILRFYLEPLFDLRLMGDKFEMEIKEC